MQNQKIRLASWALAALVVAGTANAESTFKTPLTLPAQTSALAVRAPINALTQAGQSLVAVGQRGHVLLSQDGKTWTQASVPVSADLTAVHFVNATQGWAVGHEGVILHSADGGRTWKKQLDGRRAAELALAHFGNPADATNEAAQRMKLEAEALVAQGADKPFLDVWFENAQSGYAVGAFNLIFRTEDGGNSWTPLMDRTDNPGALHLYAIRPAGDSLYVVGEQGLVLKHDPATRRFTAVQLPYQGTLFGVTGNRSSVLVYGLRGNAFRSVDGGASWTKVDTGVRVSLSAGLTRNDGSMVLVSQAGQVLHSKDNGESFKPVATTSIAPTFTAAAWSDGQVALAGLGGVRIETLKPQ